MKIEFDEIEELIQSEDRTMVFRFFLAFSRFEYALKRAGFLRKEKIPKAEADWDRFSQENNAAFERLFKSQRLQSACDFYDKNPPKKQIYKDGTLDWGEAPQQNPTYLLNLLRMVRRVRNNLFHGGKFSSLITEPARDRNLIKNSLTILKDCLPLNPLVNSFFTETEWRQPHS